MNRTSHHALAVRVTFLIGACAANLYSATFSDDNWTGMGGYAGAAGPVNATAVDGSGNLYIGGEFTAVGDLPVNYIAKWNGTNWSALGTGLQGTNGWANVYALMVSGSDLYAAGRFTMAGGVAANNIAKWNGTNWSALGSGIGGSNASVAYVYALAMVESNLYVAGDFTMAGGGAANRIAKWNGSSWSALGSGLNYFVGALAVSGNDLYAGGGFTKAGGIAASGIAKWDGSNWSALGSGLSDGVYALAVSGNNLYATGYSSTNIGKWDGSSWSAFDSAVGSGVGYPTALTVLGGELYAGGNWIGPASEFIYRAYVAKWTGSNWLELGSGIDCEWGESWDPQVYALTVSGTSVYAGGAFRCAGEVTAHCITKWNGTNWSALGSTYRYVSALTTTGRDVYGAGSFPAADGTQSNYVAKWNGSGWSPLGTGMVSDVSALAATGSDLYAGGSFTNVAGISANQIARWDGTNWSALGSGINGGVYALAVSGRDLYAAGLFTIAGGIAASNIARWNGTNWSALGAGVSGSIGFVRALAVSGRDLYAAGSFTMAGAIAANNIAKWDGTNWSALGSGIGRDRNDMVYALAVAGRNLYAGGYFFAAGGLPIWYLAKWDGSSWSAVGSRLLSYGEGPDIWTMAASGTDLYVGGWFATEDGDLHIAKWNGTCWSGLGSGVNGSVHALVVTDTELFLASDLFVGSVFVEGGFTTAGGKISPYLTRARIGSIVKSVATTNSTASIQLSGVTGYQYDVQRATNLNSPVIWTTITTSPLSPAPDGSFTFTDTNALPGPAFYRTRELP
jgi:trimeric autotransporter adhesin